MVMHFVEVAIISSALRGDVSVFFFDATAPIEFLVLLL
jgi:hypothetical protein